MTMSTELWPSSTAGGSTLISRESVGIQSWSRSKMNGGVGVVYLVAMRMIVTEQATDNVVHRSQQLHIK